MCLPKKPKTPKVPDPVAPVMQAAQKAPKQAQAVSAGKNTRDRLRAAASTLLTGSRGVGAIDTGGKKVLLGA